MGKHLTESDLKHELATALNDYFGSQQRTLTASDIADVFRNSDLDYSFNEKTQDIVINTKIGCLVELRWNVSLNHYTLNFKLSHDGMSTEYCIAKSKYVIPAPMLEDNIPMIKKSISLVEDALRNFEIRGHSLAIRKDLIDEIKDYFKNQNIDGVKAKKINGSDGEILVSANIVPNLYVQVTVDKENYLDRLPAYTKVIRRFHELFTSFPKEIAKTGTWMIRYPDPTLPDYHSGSLVRKYANLSFYQENCHEPYYKDVEDVSSLPKEMHPLVNYCIDKGIKYGLRDYGNPILIMFISVHRLLCYKKEKGAWCLFTQYNGYYGPENGSDNKTILSPFLECCPDTVLEWLNAIPDNLDYVYHLERDPSIISFLRYALAKEYLDDEALIDDTNIKFSTHKDRWVEFKMWSMCKTPKELIQLYNFFSGENKDKFLTIRSLMEKYPFIKTKSFVPDLNGKMTLEQTSLDLEP